MEYLSRECASQSVGPGNQLITLLIHTLITNYCEISKPNLWPEDYGPKLIKSDNFEYDFVIVGAGSAGSVIANRLSENPKWKVLLLEAGSDPPIESEIPTLFMSLQHTSSDWQYYTEPNKNYCLGMRNGSCFWPRGKLLGGSSGINAMIYARGTTRDFDEWEQLGNPTWGWKDVKKYFKKSEKLYDSKNLKLNEDDHSKEGLLSVSLFDRIDKIDDVIFNGASELGYKKIHDYTEGSYVGYLRGLGTTINGRRSSAAKSFLIPAKNRKNLHIVKHATVNKINFNGDKVSEVVFKLNKSTENLTIKVKKEVILSAGAIGSPQILMLSGIGPKKHLEKLGLPVIKDLPVGRNLQDHPFVFVVFQINKSKAKPISKEELLDSFYNYLMGKESVFSHEKGVSIVGFINTTDPKSSHPDIQFHHIYMRKQFQGLRNYLSALSLSENIIQTLEKANDESDLLFFYTILLKPKSLGKIKLASANINDKPKIYPNYFKEKSDLETMINALKYLTKLEQTKSFQDNEGSIVHIDIPECDENRFKSDKYWKCYTKYFSTTLYHPVGTVKMGPDNDETSVVNSRLVVKGLKGLRVTDASIIPKIIAANTNAAVIMIGEKASDFIKEDWNYDSKDINQNKVEHQEL